MSFFKKKKPLVYEYEWFQIKEEIIELKTPNSQDLHPDKVLNYSIFSIFCGYAVKKKTFFNKMN